MTTLNNGVKLVKAEFDGKSLIMQTNMDGKIVSFSAFISTDLVIHAEKVKSWASVEYRIHMINYYNLILESIKIIDETIDINYVIDTAAAKENEKTDLMYQD